MTIKSPKPATHKPLPKGSADHKGHNSLAALVNGDGKVFLEMIRGRLAAKGEKK